MNTYYRVEYHVHVSMTWVTNTSMDNLKTLTEARDCAKRMVADMGIAAVRIVKVKETKEQVGDIERNPERPV